jgi:type I restriction enzyme S subunit
MKYGLTETTVENICAVFTRFPEIEKAILYGSRAKGNFKTGSDIDLTLCGEALTSDLRSTIASALDDLLLPYTIDLSVFNELNHAKLREHIERVGVLFYERAEHGAAMKKGWECKQIGDLCEVVAGQSPEGKFYNTDGKGMPFYQGKKDFGEKFIEAPTTWTTQTTKIAREGDILMSVRAPVGPVNFATDEACIGRGLAAIRSRAELNRDFLFYQLLHLQPEIAGREGAVFASINKSEIEALPIAFAPLPEQQRIVGILDEAFEGIATAKANAEKNLQNARALFESHLQSVFTQPDKGWVKKRLEGLGTIRTGKRDANHQVENGPYPFYTCAFGQFRSPTFSFDGASIILPGNGANVGKVFFYDGKFEAYQRTYVVNELSDTINPRFLFYCFNAGWSEYIATKQFGSATNYIVVGGLKSFPVPTPSLSVQEVTVAHLDSIAAETKRLESIYQQKLTALEALKKSLLHQAFTGNL